MQVVWSASEERPGVCVVFSGDLGVWEGGGGAHTLCKWITFRVCLFLVPCFFVYLTMTYREVTQLV